MTVLTCGCNAPFDPAEPDDKYCATWMQFQYSQYGEILSTCYGLLCDKHLVSYNAERCKLGGGKL